MSLIFNNKFIDDNMINNIILKAKKVEIIMARKLRTWFPGAFYHLMHRGVRRVAIFEDEMDHQVLLQIIKTSLSKYNCWLHAYCLMTNHVHLLLETGDIEIRKFMKYMSECYAIYYNHKYGYRGHVFESRYKSCLVKEDAYFLQTSRYIHLNPVKAQMADYPEDYLWSSYRTMIGIADDGITEKKKTLAYFPKNSIYQYREVCGRYRTQIYSSGTAYQKDDRGR